MMYEPREDSYLLASVLKQYVKNKTVLDMGTGSGILALEAQKAGAREVLAVDIDSDVVRTVQKKIHVIKSDLFAKVTGRFELILFNPPYLPEDIREDNESKRITTGGKKGDELVLRFLRAAPAHLSHRGVILLLLSSLTPLDRIKALIKKLDLRHTEVACAKLWMERLWVWEIARV